jgi:hypothetical protein
VKTKKALKDNLKAPKKKDLLKKPVKRAGKKPTPVLTTTVSGGDHNPHRQASREYECFSCGQKINVGDRYARTAFKYDRGGFNIYKERACGECADLIEKIGQATGLRPSPLGVKDYLTNKVARGELKGVFITDLKALNKRFVKHGRETLTVFTVPVTRKPDGSLVNPSAGITY